MKQKWKNQKKTTTSGQKICNFEYLIQIGGTNKEFVKNILHDFLKQIPEELSIINDAINNTDYETIKRICHKMKSTVSILGISEMGNTLNEMGKLGNEADNIEKIKVLNHALIQQGKQVLFEIKIEKSRYI